MIVAIAAWTVVAWTFEAVLILILILSLRVLILARRQLARINDESKKVQQQILERLSERLNAGRPK